MTRASFLFQVMSEATGIPIKTIRKRFNRFCKMHNRPIPELAQTIPDDEAKELMEQLRKELSGILNWAIQCRLLSKKEAVAALKKDTEKRQN